MKFISWKTHLPNSDLNTKVVLIFLKTILTQSLPTVNVCYGLRQISMAFKNKIKGLNLLILINFSHI